MTISALRLGDALDTGYVSSFQIGGWVDWRSRRVRSFTLLHDGSLWDAFQPDKVFGTLKAWFLSSHSEGKSRKGRHTTESFVLLYRRRNPSVPGGDDLVQVSWELLRMLIFKKWARTPLTEGEYRLYRQLKEQDLRPLLDWDAMNTWHSRVSTLDTTTRLPSTNRPLVEERDRRHLSRVAQVATSRPSDLSSSSSPSSRAGDAPVLSWRGDGSWEVFLTADGKRPKAHTCSLQRQRSRRSSKNTIGGVSKFTCSGSIASSSSHTTHSLITSSSSASGASGMLWMPDTDTDEEMEAMSDLDDIFFDEYDGYECDLGDEPWGDEDDDMEEGETVVYDQFVVMRSAEERAKDPGPVTTDSVALSRLLSRLGSSNMTLETFPTTVEPRGCGRSTVVRACTDGLVLGGSDAATSPSRS